MKLKLTAVAVVGGVASAIVPITALLSIHVVAYGKFSAVYLVFAFFLSMQFSLVCDAWTRTRSWISSNWLGYSAISFVLAHVALVVLVFAGLMFDLQMYLSFTFALAGYASLWRSAARYYSVGNSEFSRVLVSDLIAVIVFALCFYFSHRALGNEFGVGLGWLGMSLAGALALRLPRFRRGNSPIAWLRSRIVIIKPLLSDSLLMDLGSIGSPMVLAPILGPSGFGVYRAVSNVALPVRLLIDPMRAKIASGSAMRWSNWWNLASVLLAAVVLAFGAWVSLVYLLPLVPWDLGTLPFLIPLALPVAIFVFSSLIGHLAYLGARGLLKGSHLLSGRVTQTVLAFLLPVPAALLWGLGGAVWAFAFATLISALTWMMLMFLNERRHHIL